MQFMGMSDAGGDTGLKEGEAPVSISPHPRQCPAPPPHNLTNIKSRHGTKTPPISSAVRAPLSAQCILQGFLLLLSLNLSLSVDGFWHLRTSTVIDWHWLGLRWIIPRNAADRYHDSTATLANPYIDTWALSSSCPHCLQNTEGAKEEDTGNTGRGTQGTQEGAK